MTTVEVKPVQYAAQWGHTSVQAMDHVNCMDPPPGSTGKYPGNWPNETIQQPLYLK